MCGIEVATDDYALSGLEIPRGAVPQGDALGYHMPPFQGFVGIDSPGHRPGNRFGVET
jgi:hypothetical protein